MSTSQRLLTFAWDARVVRTIASVGFDWEAVPRLHPDREAPWRLAHRLPRHVRVVSLETARRGLSDGRYDAALCHSLADVSEVASAGIPVVFRLTGTPELADATGSSREALERHIGPSVASVTRVYESPSSREAWRWPGPVIGPCLDVDSYGPYDGQLARVLVVGHVVPSLPVTAGAVLLHQATAGLPVTRCAGALAADDAATQAAVYARHRVFLDASPAWCRDGQCLSVLEAMASGLPVVTIPKPRSLVVDGEHGFVSDDPWHLRRRLLLLLSDRELAARLGEAGRQAVATHLHAREVRDQWRALFERVGTSAYPGRAAASSCAVNVIRARPSQARRELSRLR